MALEENMVQSEGLMRFPLLTHSDVVNRRRRELRASGENVDLDDNVRHLRHLQPADHSAQQLGALYQGYGTHYVDLWVGNPPQRQTAIVDTGTSATAFPCSECQNCGQHTDPPFDETKSQTFRVPTCTKDGDTSSCTFGSCSDQKCLVSRNFGSGNDASSWAAFEAQDIVYAGGLHDRPIDSSTQNAEPDDDESSPLHASEFSFPLTFGCQTSTSGYFEKQLASGVIGLDRRAQSFWGQMRAAQTIHHARFSLCFARQSISGVNAGAIMLGGVDKRLHKTPMVFAKLMEDGTTAAFKVHVRKIYMRTGHSMSETIMFDTNAKYSMLQLSEETINGKERFSIDSGTTDTYFIKSISDEFRKYWEDMTGLEYSNDPIHASDIDIGGLPTIILQMTPHEGGVGDEIKTDDPRNVPGLAGKLDLSTPNDVMFAIPANHYMQHNERDDTYSPRIYLDRDDSLGNVLGANAMMGHDMLFDMDAARIGFAESNCDYTGLVGYDGSASVQANDNHGDTQFGLKVDTVEDKGVCSSLQCRGVFGVTLALFFVGFFFFGRRYVNGGGATPHPVDLEMKSNRNLGPRYSDRHSGNSSESDRPPYRDRSSTRSVRHHGDRRLERGHGERNIQYSSSSTRRFRDSSPHAYEDRSVESDESDNSRGTRQSHRSHRSSHSHRSSNSHRSSHSRESHRSGGSSGSRESRRSSGSRESRRSSGSRESHRTGGSSREGSRDRSHSSSHRSSSGSRRHYSDKDSSRRSYRSYDDDYDNIPMPPSIT
ncbi:hypothetical protein ACHAWT_005128 [Skeletonema menzelii]